MIHLKLIRFMSIICLDLHAVHILQVHCTRDVMESLIVAAILLLVSLVVILLSCLLCRLLVVWHRHSTFGIFGQPDEEQTVLTKSDQQHTGYKVCSLKKTRKY